MPATLSRTEAAEIAAAERHVDRIEAMSPGYYRRHKTTRAKLIAAYLADAPARAARTARDAAQEAAAAAEAVHLARMPASELAIHRAERALACAEMSDDPRATIEVLAARKQLDAARAAV